jgi:hypothetical protein
MPVAAFTLPVDAPSELVWRMLADSAAMPQRFDETVESVRVIEQAADGLIREVRRGGVTRRERVTLDAASGSLTATLVGDSAYTGSMVLRAEAANPSSLGHNSPRVSARLDWQPRGGSEDAAQAARLTSELQAQLRGLKHAAEARARQQGA